MRNVRIGFWVLTAAAGLSACADYGRLSRLAPSDVDPTSAAAPAVRAASRGTYPYPDLRRLPPRPKDLPAPATIAAQAKTLTARRAALEQWAATHPVMVDDTEGYAKGARDVVLDPSRAAPPAGQAQRSADWAEKARQAAKPPPPLPPS